MKWIKNEHGGYRSDDDRWFIGETAGKWWKIWRRAGERWLMQAGAFSKAEEAKVWADGQVAG